MEMVDDVDKLPPIDIAAIPRHSTSSLGEMFRLSLVVALQIFALADYCGASAAVEELPAYVQSRSRDRISVWLGRHAEFRMAADSDCVCTEDIAKLREGGGAWPPDSNFHPYFVVGDFADDGAIDVALGVVNRSIPDQFRVLILHGQNIHGHKRADYLSEPFPLSHNGIFYGAPRPKPWRLIVGRFAAEGAMLIPKPGGYELDDGEEE
jgi:hypothetical protein